MFKIEQEQIDTLQEIRFCTFIDELKRRARLRHAETINEMSDDELENLLRDEVKQARALSLKKRSLLERFTDLSICVGSRFAMEDWARPVFTEPYLSPSQKLDKVERKAVFVLRSR